MRGIKSLAAFVLACAAPATGQDAAAAPAGCEFHVWPSDALMSVYYGWLHGSIVNGQVNGRPGYPPVPRDPIDAAAQRLILAAAAPQRLLAHPDHQLVLHETALTSREIRTTPGRLAASASPCYAELVVDDVVLQQGVAGSSLNVLFRYRDFDADALPRRTYVGWTQTHLDIFPPNHPDQLDAALLELRRAYRANLFQFAAAAMRPPRGHHRD